VTDRHTDYAMIIFIAIVMPSAMPPKP